MSREDQIIYIVLNCKPKDIAPNILLPATDYVMGIIKKHFKKVEIKSHGKIITGKYSDAAISIIASGIGAPATAMTMEALRYSEVKHIIRVDYCGSNSA